MLDLAGTPEWKRLEVAGPRPEPRAGHGAAYDAARHRLVIFGGFRFVVRDDGSIDFRYMSDAWALNLDGVPHWEQLATLGPQPDPRSGAELVSTTKVFTPGVIEQTDRALDLAILGDGFFTVELPNGQQAWAASSATPGGERARWAWRRTRRPTGSSCSAGSPPRGRRSSTVTTGRLDARPRGPVALGEPLDPRARCRPCATAKRPPSIRGRAGSRSSAACSSTRSKVRTCWMTGASTRGCAVDAG